MNKYIENAAKILARNSRGAGSQKKEFKQFLASSCQLPSLLADMAQAKLSGDARIVLCFPSPSDVADRGLWYQGLQDIPGLNPVIDILVPSGFSQIKTDLAKYGRNTFSFRDMYNTPEDVSWDDYDAIVIGPNGQSGQTEALVETVLPVADAEVFLSAFDLADLARVQAHGLAHGFSLGDIYQDPEAHQSSGVTMLVQANPGPASVETPAPRVDASLVLEYLDLERESSLCHLHAFQATDVRFGGEVRAFRYLGCDFVIDCETALVCKVATGGGKTQVTPVLELPRAQWQPMADKADAVSQDGLASAGRILLMLTRVALRCLVTYRLLTLDKFKDSDRVEKNFQQLLDMNQPDAIVALWQNASVTQWVDAAEQSGHPALFAEAAKASVIAGSPVDEQYRLLLHAYVLGSVDCGVQAARMAYAVDDTGVALKLLKECSQSNHPDAVALLSRFGTDDEGSVALARERLQWAANRGSILAMEFMQDASENHGGR